MNIKQFFADMQVEVKKVDWPTRKRVMSLVGVVLVVVVVMALFMFVVDIVIGSLLVR